MTFNVNDGTANWGPAFTTAGRSYKSGITDTGHPQITGLWGPGDDASVPGHGPILPRGHAGRRCHLPHRPRHLAAGHGRDDQLCRGTHTVEVAYNDRPGSYNDNSGSLSLTVVRTK